MELEGVGSDSLVGAVPDDGLSRGTSWHQEVGAASTGGERRVRSAEAQLVAVRLAPGAPPTPTIQALLGDRISIPCSNLTSSSQLADKPSPSTGGRARQSGRRGHAATRPPPPPAAGSSAGVSLIVWHKDDQLNAPIFVADARGVATLREAKQQTLADSLAGRARLAFAEDATQAVGLPSLVLDESTQQDAGVYTCTVEFHKAPTQTHQVRARIIEPPKNMVVRDETSQQRLYSSLAGPFDEDSRLALSCEVELNAAEPSQAGYVSWWQLEYVTHLAGAADAVFGSGGGNSPPIESAAYLTTLSGDPNSLAEVPAAGARMDDSDADDNPSFARESHDNQLVGTHSTRASLDSTLSQQRTLPGSSRQVAANQHHRQRRYLKHWRRFGNQTLQAQPQLESADSRHLAALKATMFIGQLSRSNLGDEFLCLANNNNFSSPLNATVRLDLNLKPLEVRIVNRPTFRLGQKSIVECHVFGSKPSARLSWLRGADELDLSGGGSNARPRESANSDRPVDDEAQGFLVDEFSRDMNNLTKISYLTVMPKLSDNQQSLTCSAGNPKLANSPVLSDTILMNVQYPPRLHLQLGASFSKLAQSGVSDSIKIGGDIFMDCQIDANPQIDDLTWLFNETPIQANVSAGVIMSNQSLVLQKIKVHQRGSYQCLAQNLLGKAASNKLSLRPKFRPQCDLSKTKLKYELPINQPARVDCHVLAEPNDDLHFTWQFNQTYGLLASELSADSYHVEELRKFETNFTRSSLTFVPKTKRHYGQLLCSASNTMGEQEQPCAIQVIPLEVPEPVLSCFTDNQTDSSFSVHCQPPATRGSSGQPAQQNSRSVRYLLELYSSADGGEPQPIAAATSHAKLRHQPASSRPDDLDYQSTLALNDENNSLESAEGAQQQFRLKSLASETPNFNVVGLKPNTSYSILVFVENSKGRSAPAHHAVSTRTSDSKTWSAQLSPPLESPDWRAGPVAIANNAAAGGRVELMSKGRDGAQVSVASRLISYLKIDSYLGGDFWNHDKTNPDGRRNRLLIGLASAVVALAVLIALVAILASRICKPRRAAFGEQAKRAAEREGGQLGGDAKRNELNDENSGRPAEKHYLSASAAQRHMVGSGSDTSRETNTESTLVSSPQTTETAEGGSNSAASRGKFVAFRDSQRSLGRARGAEVDAKLALSTGALGDQQSDNQRPMPAGIYSKITKNLAGNQQQQQQQLEADFREQQHSCTPQAASTQSESDCCLSANEHSSDHYAERGPQKLVGFVAEPGGVDEFDKQPVYVISRGDYRLPAGAINGIWSMDSSPTCPLAQSNREESSVATLEFSGASLDQPSRHNSCQQQQQLYSAGLVGSNTSNTGNRCQLVGPTSAAPLAPGNYMPSSVSIPVALSERLQVLSRNNNSSQSNLMSLQHPQPCRQSREFSLNPLNHSYLTLVPSSSSGCLHSSGNICLQESYFPAPTLDAVGRGESATLGAGQQADISPPVDFATDYRKFKEKFELANAAQLADQQLRQPAQCGNFCTQTLEHTHRSGLQQVAARQRRNSIDNEAQQHHHHQQPPPRNLQNRVKFDTPEGQ